MRLALLHSIVPLFHFFYVLRSDPFYFKFFIEKAGINILFLVGKHKEWTAWSHICLSFRDRYACIGVFIFKNAA